MLVISIGVYSCGNNDRKNNDTNATYQEKVESVAEIERLQPTSFLNASGTFNSTLFGNKLKVHGVIKNSATVATFKDALVKVTYYSKTNTALGSNNYTVYDFFPPNSEKTFELKIDNYKDVNSIGLAVIKATPN